MELLGADEQLRKYGRQRISLAKRAGQRRGWSTVTCTIYGRETVKTFLATYPPAGGMIRVVLVKEDSSWQAFFCTDPTASVTKILESFADRATIEQVFHDLKEVWGTGKQQVRNLRNVNVNEIDAGPIARAFCEGAAGGGGSCRGEKSRRVVRTAASQLLCHSKVGDLFVAWARQSTQRLFKFVHGFTSIKLKCRFVFPQCT